jgi:cation diffusion facilitator family transporter
MTESLINIRVQRWVAIVSVVLLTIKFFAYFLTHSVAILTDALESIANVVAGFLGLYSLILSAKPRDADHPYGHGKVEFLSAGVEGSMIALAAVLIIYKAVANLITPQPIRELDWGLILITATAVINYVMGWFCIRTAKQNNSIALASSGKHLQSDTYTTVAIIAGLGLIYITNIQWIDSVVAILMSCFILYTGYKILRSSIAGIMDESDQDLLARLVDLLNRERPEDWIDLHNLRVIKYGSTLHLDCHLTLPWYLNVFEAHNRIKILEKLIQTEFGDSIEIFVHIDACRDFSCNICEKKDCNERKHPFVKSIKWSVLNISSNKMHDTRS